MGAIADFALTVLLRSGLVAAAGLVLARMRVRHSVLAAAWIACAIVPWIPSPAAPIVAGAPSGPPPSNALPFSIAALYLIATAYHCVSLLLAWRSSRRLRVQTSEPPAAAIAALETCARALGVTSKLRSSPRATVPMTVGSLILLPASLPEDALLPVIAHELAHVRRRDSLVHAMLKIVTLPVAFHPLVRMLERRVAVAREIACDALVTSTLVEPQRYARTLLSVAEHAAPRHAMAFGSADALELRLVSLRGMRPSRRWIGAAFVIALIAFGASQLPLHVFARRPDLTGTWTLDRAASRSMYDAITARIVQTPGTISSWQTRVRKGRTMRVQFSVVTDGVTRNLRLANVDGRGAAYWQGSQLITTFSTRQGQHEETHLWLADSNTLIAQAVGQKTTHVFRRKQ